MIDSKTKLALYRKLEADVASGIMLALDIFNEELGRIVEEKKTELENVLKSMDKEIQQRELKDGEDGEDGEPGKQGPAGKDGEKGKDGAMGLPGKAGKDGINGKDGKQGQPGKPGKDGKDGKDGSPDTPDELVAKINKASLKIYASQITGLSRDKKKVASSYKHGGGDTVSAGSNVTIITNADGTKTISASSGSFTELPATGAINSVNTAFTFSTKPSYVIRDGVFMKENKGWTWNAGTLTATLSIPPDTDIYGIQ